MGVGLTELSSYTMFETNDGLALHDRIAMQGHHVDLDFVKGSKVSMDP